MARPYEIPVLNMNQQAPSTVGSMPNRGVSLIAVSFDSRYAASKDEASPQIVWIWDLVELSLNSVLVQQAIVSDLAWCPHTHNLNVSCAGQSKLYLWSPKGASVC